MGVKFQTFSTRPLRVSGLCHWSNRWLAGRLQLNSQSDLLTWHTGPIQCSRHSLGILQTKTEGDSEQLGLLDASWPSPSVPACSCLPSPAGRRPGQGGLCLSMRTALGTGGSQGERANREGRQGLWKFQDGSGKRLGQGEEVWCLHWYGLFPARAAHWQASCVHRLRSAFAEGAGPCSHCDARSWRSF